MDETKYFKQYYQENKERLKKNYRKFYELHKVEILTKNKGWYNRLRQNKTTEEWKAYRLGKTIAQREYRLKNKDKINANRQKGTETYKKQQSYRRNNLLNVNGKNITVRKRGYTGKCEICGINQEFVKYNYHHWDDTNPAKGIWVCCRCHTVVEGIERNIHNKYFNLKDQVEELFNMQSGHEAQGQPTQGGQANA